MGGKNVKNTILEKMLEIIAPHPCYSCDKGGNILCYSCKNDIENEPITLCSGCFLPILGTCKCDTGRVWVVGARHGGLKRVVDAFKFERVQSAAPHLAELLHYRVPILPPNTVVVPVPTRGAHIRQRGYDHALLLAQSFAKLRNYEVSCVLGTSLKKAQHNLGKDDRKMQADQGFYITGKLETGRPHLIVDDIITTGSTISAVRSLIESAGVKTIFMSSLAYQALD